MARTRTASRSRASQAALTEEPVGLELLGLALALAGALAAASLLTIVPEGAGGDRKNLVGALGNGLAGVLTRGFGLGAWMLPIFGITWGIRCMRGRPPAHFARKAMLLPVLVALMSIFAALVLPALALPGIERTGPGGYFGLAFGTTLWNLTNKAAGLIVLVGLLAVLRLMVEIDLRPIGSFVAQALTLKEPAVVDVEEEVEDDGDAWAEEDVEDEGYGEGEDDDEWEYEDEEEYEYEYEDEDDAAEEDAEEEPEAPKPETKQQAAARRAMVLPPRRPRKPRIERLADRGEYRTPALDLLNMGVDADADAIREEVAANVQVLEEALASFGVEARVVSSLRGPVITFCEIKVPSGIRLNRVTALHEDLAIALKAPSVRIVAPIPGRSTVGIEVPNLQRDTVCLRDLLEETDKTLDRKAVPIMLGRDTAGRPIVEDLATMPHLLIAGATGSGKSVCINSVLLSVLFTRAPDEVNLILVDPKQVELSFYEGIPHLLTPVVTDMKRASKILEWAVERMEERYSFLLQAGVRNISGYNNIGAEKIGKIREKKDLTEEMLPDHMPYLVIVVDELADLMLTNGKEVELAITRLAQKSRAVGIHLVLATQRPSTNVITGLIKANMPTRISFTVSSKIDSRVILDANGADKLLGKGDMLYMHPRSLHLRRAQGTLVTDEEARAVLDFLKEQYPEPEYEDLLAKKNEGMGDPMKEDDLYDDAVRAVLSTKLGSASMLQRRLGVGYTRASRLIDMMCDRQVVGPHVGSKAREVLMDLDDWEAMRAAEQGQPARPSDAFDPDEPVDESWD
ncbi:MAG: DNA translocase FtsK 4TM domain-containing protein [Planctomycetota bacterium]|nr:DNA translocase FtsK 4TM domain-containing protein [Planctomycetota bacterium]